MLTLTITKMLAVFIIFIIGVIFARASSNILRNFLKTFKTDKIVEKGVGIKIRSEEYLPLLLKAVIYYVTIVIIINTLKISLSFLKLISILFMAIIAIFILLIYKDIIPNITSRLYLKKTKRIKEGSNINILGVKGKIIKLGLTELRIKTKERDIIFIPNALLLKQILKNGNGFYFGVSKGK